MTDERSSLGERTEAPPVANEARRASGSGRNFVSECEQKISGTATGQANAKHLWEEPGEMTQDLTKPQAPAEGNEKSPPRNQKKAHICLPDNVCFFQLNPPSPE